MILRHYLQFHDFSRAEYDYILERAHWIKSQFKQYKPYHPLVDRTLAMIFEKQSTRTRLSFEAGVQQLGGSAIFLNTRDTQLGREVAIKVLPDEFARDPERLARFQQEARVLAALNHANIATIHGLE